MKKVSHTKLKQLTSTFRKLGAKEPEMWAESELGGTPQLARFCFLKWAWEGIVEEDHDNSWMERVLRHEDSLGGQALVKILKAGAHRSDVTDLVRHMQHEVLMHICCMLDGVSSPSFVIDNMNFSVVRTDDDGNIIDLPDGLHESTLQLDPTGRELSPR